MFKKIGNKSWKKKVFYNIFLLAGVEMQCFKCVLFVCVQEFVGEMESVESSLKQMGENVAAVQQSALPGLTSWGQKELDECQMRWDLLSKEVWKMSSAQMSTSLKAWRFQS